MLGYWKGKEAPSEIISFSLTILTIPFIELFQGFKRPSCAFFTLIQQITSSNWHEMMNSVTAASGVWAYFYFCMFYITINLVLLDLTIAMTIEMYNAIKFQYFNKPKSGTGSEENEGVIFEVTHIL